MKKTHILLLIFVLALGAVQAQKHTLNGTWHFQTDLYKQGIKEKWYSPDFQPVGWDEMAVPGNWDLENEYADYAGVAWYRRSFETEKAWKSKRVRLYFESVFNDAEVWLNGKKIAENHLGFLPFWKDVQQFLNDEGENVLVVRVDNTFKRGAIWNWGGIRRPVWLEVTPMVRLEQQHITAVPDLAKGTAEVSVKLRFSNAAETAQTVGYRLTLRNPQGEVIHQTEEKSSLEVPLQAEKSATINIKLKKKAVQLWHFNHPHLYTATAELLRNGQPIHQLTDRFGIRKIEVDGYDFKLNGESVRTVGFNLVAEDRTTGNTLPLWRIKEDVDMMKQLGANMARVSHLPLPKEFLDYLDERGIMTFEEVSLWGKDAMADPDHPTPKAWLERMVQYKFNHPSIIGWSVGNEIGFLNANPKVMEYVEGAVEHAHRLDPTRLAIYVTHSAQVQEEDPVEFSDMIMFNRYGSWGKDSDKVNNLHPNKPIFMSEYGKELNAENPDEAFIDAKAILDAMRGREYLMGVSLWTFNDYRSFWKSNPTWTTPPSQNRTWGVVTSLREKKQPYFAFRREYAPVKSMAFQAEEGANSGNVTLTPRGKLDLPAYPMRGYRLLWATFDDAGKVTSGSFTELPEILPGDAAKSFPVEWSETDAVRLALHLLDPQDYSVLDTVMYFEVPSTPEILSVHTSEQTARVVFEPVRNATSYAMRYRKSGGAWQQTEPTINHFLEVGDLQGFTEYDFSVLPINGAGEGQPSEVVTASTDEEVLPPIIWKTVPADEAFFVGYSVDRQDYLYEVAIGEKSGNYTDTLILRNVGVLKIPNLENGKTYYYKMRLRKQWGFASEWTHEIRVTPDGGKAQGNPEVLGTLSNADKNILLFKPVEKATGYELELEGGEKITIPTAQSGFFTFEGNGEANEANDNPNVKLVTKKQPDFAVNADFEILDGEHKFYSNLTLLYAKASPDLNMRPSGIENVTYNVATWQAISDADLLEQVQRDEAQQGDGFDESILSSKTKNRTANLFMAGVPIDFKPEKSYKKGDTTVIQYQAHEYAEVVAKVFEENHRTCFKVELKPLVDGYFSVGFMNAPAHSLDETEGLWQPLIWQEKRFPDRPYMTLAYRCPIPSALATFDGTTFGVIAHPDEFPFQPLPLEDNSRFGVAVRNRKGTVQPMLFAPVLGGAESQMKANESYSFTSILYANEGNCTDNYEQIARDIFGFGDYRKNEIATLNHTFENMVDYAMSEYAWFIDSLKGCAYSTDVPDAVKNVSSLNPLELALVTDNSEIFQKRAYPIMEYQISREKFLFALDKEQKIQHPSRKMLGPIAPISELTALYNIFGKDMPFLVALAKEAYQTKKVRNLDVVEDGDSWMNSMFLYEATGEERYLQKAIEGADEYLKYRMETPQTGFDDPLAGGFFFWTGYTPRWIYLLELYELTNDQKYLDAAHQGARQYTTFCWMSPKVPDENILVNEGGKAPLYWYLERKGHRQMLAEEETVPAWRLSEMGLTPESSSTSTGHRAIFMANYAPWMLRIGHYAQDQFLKEVAKAAIIGRYRNFPGYHINTARTTIYEKADYPLRPHKELSVNSFHYNHIMPMASMLLDYLVTDAFTKSNGKISFPSEFIEGYAYLQNKFYGHKKGTWYGEDVWLWMPPKLVETGSVELNYISARGEGKFFVALSNQSPNAVETWVKINPDLVEMSGKSMAQTSIGERLPIENGLIKVKIPAFGQLPLTLSSVRTNAHLQPKLVSGEKPWANDFASLATGNTNAMVFNCGALANNLYVYLEDDDEVFSQVKLYVKQEGKVKEYSDANYPYEFTIPITENKVSFQLIATTQSGEVQESEWGELKR